MRKAIPVFLVFLLVFSVCFSREVYRTDIICYNGSRFRETFPHLYDHRIKWRLFILRYKNKLRRGYRLKERNDDGTEKWWVASLDTSAHGIGC